MIGKRIDQWFQPKKIYDAHCHFFTYSGLLQRASKQSEEKPEELIKKFSERINTPITLPPKDDKEFLQIWIDELDRNNVDKVVTLPDWNMDEFVRLGMSEYPDRFIPFLMIDPREKGVVDLLETAYSDFNLKGIKLYPPIHYYHAFDPMLDQIYEFINDHRLIITYHMGISIGSQADLRYMNPSDVSPVARENPHTNFLFAHFATGYLKELLFLMYHLDNIYAETSSSNKWMEYLPYQINLIDVFKRVIDVKGVEKLIFGTDSTHFPRGWRQAIFQNQLSVCNQLGLKQEEIDKIFYGNLERLI